MKPKIEQPKIGSKISDTLYLSNEMMKKNSMGCKNIRKNQGKISSIPLKISGNVFLK